MDVLALAAENKRLQQQLAQQILENENLRRKYVVFQEKSSKPVQRVPITISKNYFKYQKYASRRSATVRYDKTKIEPRLYTHCEHVQSFTP